MESTEKDLLTPSVTCNLLTLFLKQRICTFQEPEASHYYSSIHYTGLVFALKLSQFHTKEWLSVLDPDEINLHIHAMCSGLWIQKFLK